jgi:hypothetical protein
VRQAVRARYLGKAEERRRAMEEFVGSRKSRTDLPETEEYVRGLRRGGRTEMLGRE